MPGLIGLGVAGTIGFDKLKARKANNTPALGYEPQGGAVSAADVEQVVSDWFDDPAGYTATAYLGDPATNTIPAKLLDKQYAKQLAASIDLTRATPSEDLAGDIKITSEGEHTTHISVIDRDRAAVSLTYTLFTEHFVRLHGQYLPLPCC